jgi:hypothetical protein
MRRGWHTAAMTNAQPPNPNLNQVWVDDKGELKRFDGSDWVPYLDVPDSPLYEPWAVEKKDTEETDDDGETDAGEGGQ